MIQFNLLPDVKLDYIKAVQRKRLISFVAIIVSSVSIIVFVLLFLFVRVNQTRHLANLDSDIKSSVDKLKENPDLDKILTIQNQLKSLPGLHDQKVLSSRVFSYLGQLTPAQATITTADIDLEANTILIKGGADSVVTVNKFIDTLKFTDFSFGGDNAVTDKAFGNVVLQRFTVQKDANPQSGSAQVTYEINMEFKAEIFANTAKEGSAVANDVTLTVPNIVTTRSETQKPVDLFKPKADEPVVNETESEI